MYSFIHSRPQIFIDFFFPLCLLLLLFVVVCCVEILFACLLSADSHPISQFSLTCRSLENRITQQLHPITLGNGSQRTFLRTPGLDNLDGLRFPLLLNFNAQHTTALYKCSQKDWSI